MKNLLIAFAFVATGLLWLGCAQPPVSVIDSRLEDELRDDQNNEYNPVEGNTFLVVGIKTRKISFLTSELSIQIQDGKIYPAIGVKTGSILMMGEIEVSMDEDKTYTGEVVFSIPVQELKKIKGLAYKDNPVVPVPIPEVGEKQNESPPVEESESPVSEYSPTLFEVVPEPDGGMAALFENIKYPEGAVEQGIEGKVIVAVFFDEQGNVIKSEIARSVNDSLDQAAIVAIRSTRWKPGQIGGNNTAGWLLVPVTFSLE